MTKTNFTISHSVAVVGGGPAGLMAAEVLIQSGIHVDLYDSMPSVGRKFLVAGKGGLNLTNAEDRELFLSRYGTRRLQLEPIIDQFSPDALRQWLQNLGIDTFIGSSRRVFPVGMKTSPILRAWILRLREAGIVFHLRHRWVGWDRDGSLYINTPDGDVSVRPDAVIFALGGGSWARLGSTGAWVQPMTERGVKVAPLRPSNCGFNVVWSDVFRNRFEGVPVKSVMISLTDSQGNTIRKIGEFIITRTGIEGGLIYSISAQIRDEIETNKSAVISLDLAPSWTYLQLRDRLSQPRGSQTITKQLERAVKIKGVKAGLLREYLTKEDFSKPECIASAIKELPVQLISPRPLDEAISSAGGVLFEELDEHLMVRSLPGVFCAGEMLDWEAPTGGYLLTACFATGRTAGQGALNWLEREK